MNQIQVTYFSSGQNKEKKGVDHKKKKKKKKIILFFTFYLNLVDQKIV